MIFWLTLICSTWPQAGAQSSRAIRYEDLPKLVRERNDRVRAAESLYSAQKERGGHFVRSFLPKISARAGNESYKRETFSQKEQGYWQVEGHFNLYRGGRDMAESDARAAGEKVAKSELARDYAQELTEARKAYWSLVGIGQIINDRRQAVEINEGYIKFSRRRAGAGVSTSADFLQFELHKTLLQQDLKKLTLEQDLLRNKLSVAIGADEHENIVVPENFPHPPDNQENEPKFSLESNVHLQIGKAREERERARSRISSRAWLPQIDFYSTYGTPSLSNKHDVAIQKDSEVTVGVLVTIDLTDGVDSIYEARARALEAQAESLKAQHKLRETVAADHELRHDMKLLHELIHDSDKDILRAESFLKLTHSEYSRGVKNGPDLLEAFKRLYEFRDRRVSLYREYNEAYADLLELLTPINLPRD